MSASLENLMRSYRDNNLVTGYKITRGNRMGGMKSKVITVEYTAGNIVHVTEFALNKPSVPSFISRKDSRDGFVLEPVVYDQTLADFKIAIDKTLA